MSGISDSKVTFAERCKRYGLSQEHVEDLKQKGVATYGQLLFRVASGPNQVDDSKLSDLLSSCRPNLTDSGKSAIKRLVFEAGTFVVAELKDAISSPVLKESNGSHRRNAIPGLMQFSKSLGALP